jgi:hypothetical protein
LPIFFRYKTFTADVLSLLNDIIVFCLAVLGGQEISQASNKWLWGHP